MDTLLVATCLGFIGGITRIFVGLLKLKSKSKFSYSRLIFTLLASWIIGIFCSLLISTDYALALVACYAGTDLIEGIYKITKD